MYSWGFTKAAYIFCIEHLRSMHLSRESNPVPPALQANTLCKEPFEQRYQLLFGTSNCTTTASPKLRCRKLFGIRIMAEFDSNADISDIARVEVRIAGEGESPLTSISGRRSRGLVPLQHITSGSPLCRGLTRAMYILCIEHLSISVGNRTWGLLH